VQAYAAGDDVHFADFAFSGQMWKKVKILSVLSMYSDPNFKASFSAACPLLPCIF